MVIPDFEAFCERAGEGNAVPLSRELLADMETPISVFRKLEAAGNYCFLLESVEQGEQLGRYTFMGANPALILRVRGEEQEVLGPDGQPADFPIGETPIATLRALLARYRPVHDHRLPPFIGGAVGYMSYDTVRYYERIPDRHPNEDGLPDCVIMVAESVIAFDHVRHRLVLITNALTAGEADLRRVYTEAEARLDELRDVVLGPLPTAPSRQPAPAPHREETLEAFADLRVPVTSNFTRPEFEHIVLRAKEYIAAGDIFQVVLSQRFSASITCPAFDVYRSLRAVNPSPYMFYLKCGPELQIAGSSPEILVRLAEGKVVVRPIAGTRPRGATPREDHAHERDLLADEKEIAEHIMLVDLGRNDIGRVCEYGTVTVDDFMVIERYSHVMHIVSNVTGRIREGCDGLDALAATFPAGTLSGAPKIRAMEIIDELEKSRRGPYGGTVVYFSSDGTMDSCITIRTAVITGNRVTVQAGAGIVADSVPENEYMETVNKARGMLKAIDMAERGLE